MATVWFRETTEDEWRIATPFWNSINEQRAHNIADTYNPKHDYGMWWVTKHPSQKPPEDAQP